VSLRAGRAGPLALTAALAVLLVAGATTVLAHAELVASDPPAGAQLAEPPTTVTLEFSEGLDASKSSFRLNKDGQNIGTGRAAADGDTTMTLTGLTLEPGDYVIRWTSAADDGHLERGTIGFTVLQPTPAPTAPPTVNPTDDVLPSESPSAPASVAPSEPPVTPSPAPSPNSGNTSGNGSDVILPILLALAIVAVVGAYVLRRSRQA
jgi:methionine-rich copper-binding protein CopC